MWVNITSVAGTYYFRHFSWTWAQIRWNPQCQGTREEADNKICSFFTPSQIHVPIACQCVFKSPPIGAFVLQNKSQWFLEHLEVPSVPGVILCSCFLAGLKTSMSFAYASHTSMTPSLPIHQYHRNWVLHRAYYISTNLLFDLSDQVSFLVMFQPVLTLWTLIFPLPHHTCNCLIWDCGYSSENQCYESYN